MKRGLKKIRSTYPFPIRILMLFMRRVQIRSIKPAYCQRERELDYSIYGVQDVAQRELAAMFESHFGCRRGLRDRQYGILRFMVVVILED